ncbi:MAG: hypothetical protein E6507_09150 [Prevotella bivia]|nr:hypothetical protein [Prevotella bivia]KXU57445.1 hypothetical protein HMPREF3218_0201421 [Prevotella bivia]MDK7763796.1 hypothetical protein [Prevotella bivia]MDU2328441.1 hypothetical protein [Prevotella bivia]MDU6555013.1 hypothetical protein [Prevotella bivia]
MIVVKFVVQSNGKVGHAQIMRGADINGDEGIFKNNKYLLKGEI